MHLMSSLIRCRYLSISTSSSALYFISSPVSFVRYLFIDMLCRKIILHDCVLHRMLPGVWRLIKGCYDILVSRHHFYFCFSS